MKQIYDADFSLFTWPSSPVLAQYIFFHADTLFRGKNILEIGCGTCLPGMTAVKIGCKVLCLADKFSSIKSKDLVEQNLKDNEIPFSWYDSSSELRRNNEEQTIFLTKLVWGSMFEEDCPLTNSQDDIKFDYIIASDCFYDEKDFENILCTVNFLLRFKCNPGSCFLTSYQERHSNWNIQCLLFQWKLKGESIPLADFEADSVNLLGSSLPGNHTIHLFKIVLASE